MKSFFLALIALTILTGCPSEQEIKETKDLLLIKRTEATNVINSGEFTLEGLLKAQAYFFDFGEKVHLMKEDKKAREEIRALINSTGVRRFCTDFVLPIRIWQILEDYCQTGTFYKCSSDIKEYRYTHNKFYELIGVDLERAFKNEPNCY